MVVTCGEPQHLDGHRDVIINPKVVIEVLSPTTEDFDRRVKFGRYRMWNDTLTDYLLISQNQAFVEHFQRRENSEWIYDSYWELSQEVPIKSIGCVLPMTEIYDRINFPHDPEDDAEDLEEAD